MANTNQQIYTDKRLQNLKPAWKPGESGNPAGRPKNTESITWWYKQLLAENEGITAREIAEVTIERARQGSLPHTQEITDRTDGRVAEKHLNVSVIAHIGEEYTKEVLESMQFAEIERQGRLLLTEKTQELT